MAIPDFDNAAKWVAFFCRRPKWQKIILFVILVLGIFLYFWLGPMRTPQNENVQLKKDLSEAKLSKADAAINTLKSMETPMSPEAFSKAMKLADRHKLSIEYGIEIKLTVEMNDGTILTGISTGAHGHNAKRGYRYYINSGTGVTQEFYLADVHVISNFTISEIK